MMHVLSLSIIYPSGAEILQLIDVRYIVIIYPISVLLERSHIVVEVPAIVLISSSKQNVCSE